MLPGAFRALYTLWGVEANFLPTFKHRTYFSLSRIADNTDYSIDKYYNNLYRFLCPFARGKYPRDLGTPPARGKYPP